MRTKPWDLTGLTFLIIGAINWGLIGFFQFDLVAAFFGGVDAWASRVIYSVIGLFGLYCLTMYGRIREERADFAGRD